MDIVVLKQAQKELTVAPKDILQDVFALFSALAGGVNLEMPVSRPLPTIARGLHELRLSGKSGEYRVFYFISLRDAIYVIHAGNKKTQSMSKLTKRLLRTRIRSLHG